jgi:tetratricopeptide (TPR) repeat protein
MWIIKKNSIKLVFSVYFLCTASIIGNAQKMEYYENPKYGPDSISRTECAKNLSNMSSYVKVNMPDYAYSSWRYCFHNCPAASKNIYIMGAKILKHKIENSANEELANRYIDTLMILYDQRIKYYGQEGYVLGWKGVDLLKYRPEEMKTGYDYLKESLDIMKSRAEEGVAITLMQATNALYKDKVICEDEVIHTYIKINDYLNERLNSKEASEKTEIAIDNVEKIFAACGAANCETLESIFLPKFKTGLEDVETLKNISDILENNNCTESDLYLNVLVELFNVEPAAYTAKRIAPLYHLRGDYENSTLYIKKALQLETDDAAKAKLYIYLAQICKDNLKDYSLARSYAYEALKLNDKFGEPYLLIGDAYVASSKECSESEFEQRAVYWAAVDKYEKAKYTDPSISNKAEKLIDRYSDHFPLKEETFFHGYVDGQEYLVGCWINEKTIVRTRQN